MEIIYSEEAQEHIRKWKKSGDKKVMNRISALLSSIEQDPFTGIGKPESLKFNLSGYWSRRISKEHRLVYKVVDRNTVEVISLMFHYD